jgi:hypothetical protein
MTATAELVLPEPVGLQYDWLDSSASKKVLRVGRRGSKTRFAFFASLMGHGPGWEDDAPRFPGVLQGWDVIWFAQTYTNLSTVLWHEEIVPRMQGLPYVELNTTKHDVTFTGLGSLMLRSADAEAIKSVRGAGKRLRGVIVDEAAWLALRSALLDIILPALLDNDGWLILMSTTNAGQDGGYDDQGAPQVPSYFNVICEEIRSGKRGPDWAEFYGTAYDNPTLNPVAIDALIAEYPPDSPKLKQEVFAELLAAGIGLALPELDAKTHVVRRFPIPSHWTQWGAFDWGFNHPWVFGWYACDEDGNVVKVDTLWGREDLPDVIGSTIARAVPVTRERFVVHAGPDIFMKKGAAVGFQGPTIAEALGRHGLKLIAANNSRVLGLNNLRAYAHVNEKTKAPRFTLMETEGNTRCLAQLQSMQIDPKDLEDALKVDADAAGRGGDDSYDETRYGLMARPLTSTAPPIGEPREGQSLGYDYAKHRPRERETADQLVSKMIHGAIPNARSGRYRVPVRRG